MKEYKTLLLDIDDTLLDFKVDQKIAFSKAIYAIGYELTDEMYETYKKINNGMWELFEKNEITMKELTTKRIEIFFEKYNINKNVEEFKETFTQMFQITGTLLDNPIEILDKLKEKYELVIVSNGIKDQQYHRLKNSGLINYFQKFFISEEIGYNKPDIRFFEIVFEGIENRDKSEMLIIGDSLTSDMTGGNNAGIDTCWFNKNNKVNDKNVELTYEIKELKEIFNIIEGV